MFAEGPLRILAYSLALQVHGVTSSNDIAKAFEKSDAIIEFSSPEAAVACYEIANVYHKPLISGTTGLSDKHVAILNRIAKTTPVFYSPNMSRAIYVMAKMLALTSSMLKNEFNADMIETHHIAKKDIPSGTALMLARAISYPIPIHSVRTDNCAGEHTVSFFNHEECIEITHKALDRKIFAHGALRAAKWLYEHKTPGLYGMDDLINCQ